MSRVQWPDDWYRWPARGHSQPGEGGRWARPVGRVWLGRSDRHPGHWWKDEAPLNVAAGVGASFHDRWRGANHVEQIVAPAISQIPSPQFRGQAVTTKKPTLSLAGGLAGWPQSGGHCLLHDVWSWNFQYEWEAFMSILSEKAHPERPVMVALDTEFPGFLLEDHPFAPRSARYTALRENVDYLWPIQFGLAVADSDGAPLGAWTFNLSFNLATSLYSEDSVRFLQAAGVDFPRHAVEGIEPSTLAWKLSRSPLVGMHRNSPEWVTFSGWYDWGYLLKLVTGNPMPYDINAFDELLSTLCPTRKELRDLLPRGSLDALLGSHGLRRLGPAHTAGSDALATLELFLHVRMNGTNEEAAKALTLADGKALIDPVAPSDDIADAENSGTSTATGTTDDAQASSRDVSADVENEPCVSEAGSHSGSEPWKQISDEEPELWEVPHRHHHRLELRGLRRVRHRHRGPRHRYVDDGPPFPVPHRWHFDSTVTERSRPLSERILEFIDIDNEVWEPVLKVFHATGYTSLFFIIAIFTLTVFSALYLLL